MLWTNLFTMSNISIVFFPIWVFFHEHSRITGVQDKGKGISLTPHYHFHPLRRHVDISREITADSSPLHIASSWTRTKHLWFPRASRYSLSHAPLYIFCYNIHSFICLIFFHSFNILFSSFTAHQITFYFSLGFFYELLFYGNQLIRITIDYPKWFCI